MIRLSPGQADGVRGLTQWFRHGTPRQQTFFLAGYAGTGKSTTLGHGVGELGLDGSAIAYACFTMKAALVLRRNGLPASTIHRLIYSRSSRRNRPPRRRAQSSKDYVKRARATCRGHCGGCGYSSSSNSSTTAGN
jgi:AAA domain